MLEKLKEELVQLHLELAKNILVTWTSGNVSGREPQTGLVVIKPSDIRYEDLRSENMAVVDLTYPIAEQIEGVIEAHDAKIDVINTNVFALTDLQRTDTGLQFTWQNSNPSEYPLRVHIGIPPVIGEDGIIYGYYEIMDLESPPITPAGSTIDWTTAVVTPKEVKGFYILLSYESGKQRQYANWAIDITDK